MCSRAALDYSHIPSQPMSIPSSRGVISRDSCLQHDTRNSSSTSGNFFGSLPARGETPSAIFEKFKEFGIVSLRIGANWHRQNFGTGRRSETRTAGSYNTNSSIGQESDDLESIMPCWRNLVSELYNGKSPRNPISELHSGIFPRWVGFQRWNVNFKIEACSNSGYPTITM